MFAGIAGRYDLANHLLSGGVDFHWRKRLVRMVAACHPQVVLDLATGSGDVAFALQKALPAGTRITGMDFCQPMLDQAEEKKKKSPSPDSIQFALGDCMDLPVETNSVDAVTIAFGVRNFEDRLRGLREIHRVLKPGGSLFVLEFSQPAKAFKPFYYFYLKAILPLLAGITTGRKDAYHYLADSIEGFPDKPTLCRQLEEAGFAQVHATGLTFSIVAIHHAEKQGQ